MCRTCGPTATATSWTPWPRGEMYYIPGSQVPARLHATQWVGDHSEAFIREHARTREDAREGGDRPFFLFSSYIHPHPPFAPPTPWNKLYRGPLMPLPKRPAQREALWTWANRHQNRYKYRDNGIDDNLLRVIKAHYYACISFVDYQVGRLLAALEETGMLDDTLILFASDHGELLGDYDCFGKRSMPDSPRACRSWPGCPAAFGRARRDAATSLVDIAHGARRGVRRGCLLDGLDSPRSPSAPTWPGAPCTPSSSAVASGCMG